MYNPLNGLTKILFINDINICFFVLLKNVYIAGNSKSDYMRELDFDTKKQQVDFFQPVVTWMYAVLFYDSNMMAMLKLFDETFQSIGHDNIAAQLFHILGL